MPPSTILLRLFLTFLAAFAFGVYRQRRGKPIGFGTFTFVGVGACGAALLAVNDHGENPLPLMSAIVTGIGFLGAGALLRSADRVVGFTSAATIWVFAIFGLAVGVGEYLIGGLIYGVVVSVSAFDAWMELQWYGAHQRRLCVTLVDGTSDEVLDAELNLPPRSRAQAVERDAEAGTLTLTYSLRRPPGEDGVMLVRLESSPSVRRFTLE